MEARHILELPPIDSCENLSSDDFLQYYGKPNLPFLLKNGIQNTKAMQKWDWDFFGKKFQQREIIVYRSGNRNDFKKIYFNDYIDYVHQTEDKQPYYLLDWFVDKHCPELRNDYAVPSYLHSWTDFLPKVWQPKFLSFYIGPKNSWSPLHIDILSTSAWNALFRGHKLWVFFPYEQSSLLYKGKVNPFTPDHDRFPLYKNAKGLYALQSPGDLIFTPSNWWHAVFNLESSISLTDNFINRSNARIFINKFFPSMHYLLKRTWIRRKQAYN